MKVDDNMLYYRPETSAGTLDRPHVPWPHEQPFLLPYFHIYWGRRPTLHVGVINQKPWLPAGEAYDMYGLTVGHDLCIDCQGVWLHWGQRRYGFFVRPVRR